MHVDKGERTFIKDDDSFADVMRTRIFGKESSGVVVQMDDGSYKAFIGNSVNQVVNTETQKDANGTDFELPMDVKKHGPSILSAIGLDAENQRALFQKFMVLPKDVRRAKMKEWKDSEGDSTKESTFLSEILGLLDDDTLFIQTQASKLLSHFDDTTRGQMLTKLNSITTSEQRKQLILKYTAVKYNKKSVERFMQELYKLLLEDDEYLVMQMKVHGIKLINEPELSRKILAFMEHRDEAYRQRIVNIWRARSYFISKTGPRWIRNLLKSY